jgi:hypothetical protein
MDVDFVPTSADVLLSADRGTQINFDLRVKADSSRFEFPGADNIEDCIFSLEIHQASQAKQDVEDGRIGEIRPFVVRSSNIHAPSGL